MRVSSAALVPASPPTWAEAIAAASTHAPARLFRQRLAASVRDACGALFTAVTTCPPGHWLALEQDSVPEHFGPLISRIRDEFVPRIDKVGEGWEFAIARHGIVYAPLETAVHKDLARELRKTVLEPAGINGYVVAYMVSPRRGLLGFIVVGAEDDSESLLARARDRLEEVAQVALGTIETSLEMVTGFGVVLPDWQRGLSRLTTRERQVAHLAVAGFSNLNIGAQLGIAEQTVSVHLKRIYEKLGVHSRGDLAARLSGIAG